MVAAKTIPYGAKLEAGHLRLALYPKAAAPDGSFAAVKDVLAQDAGAPVVLVAMSPKEPVLRTKLSGSAPSPRWRR